MKMTKKFNYQSLVKLAFDDNPEVYPIGRNFKTLNRNSSRIVYFEIDLSK